MQLRDAQEEARVVYTAMRDSVGGEADPLVSHVAEVIAVLEKLRDTERSSWGQVITDQNRAVGRMLLVALELANEFEIDSLEALKAVFLEESP